MEATNLAMVMFNSLAGWTMNSSLLLAYFQIQPIITIWIMFTIKEFMKQSARYLNEISMPKCSSFRYATKHIELESAYIFNSFGFEDFKS